MADPIAELNAVLMTCGITNQESRDRIIDLEGFNSIDDFGVLENDQDVNEMAKRLASRTQVDGRVILGTVVIKRLQALVWWVNDHQRRNQDINVADWTPAEMVSAMSRKAIHKGELERSDPSVKDLKKFDPEDFELHEDAFKNLLAQTNGVRGEKLCYVIHDETPPEEFASEEERRMYQVPLEGDSYEADNTSVYQKLKAFLIDTEGWTWIKEFDRSENGRAAYMAWTNHYNGRAELSKRTAKAKAKIKALYYRSETGLPFESYSGQLKHCFQTLNKDRHEARSQRQQVEKLLSGIKTEDGELKGAKAVIRQDYAKDFDGACAYFSSAVSNIHGDAQLEYNRYKSRKRSVYSVDRNFGRGGRGCGRFSGRFAGGRGGGRGGRGFGRGSGNSGRTIIHGIDVTDVTGNFSQQEWTALQNDGCSYVMRERNILNGCSQQSGNGRGGGANRMDYQNETRNASAVETNNSGEEQSGDANPGSQQNGKRGGRNGRGFGRGAYGGRGGRSGRN